MTITNLILSIPLIHFLMEKDSLLFMLQVTIGLTGILMLSLWLAKNCLMSLIQVFKLSLTPEPTKQLNLILRHTSYAVLTWMAGLGLSLSSLAIFFFPYLIFTIN